MVEPVDVFEGGVFDVVDGAPWPSPADEFVLVEPDGGLGHGVVDRVAEESISRVLEKEGHRLSHLSATMRESISEPGYRLFASYLDARRDTDVDSTAAAVILVGALVNLRRSTWTFGQPPAGLDDDHALDVWVRLCLAERTGLTRERPSLSPRASGKVGQPRPWRRRALAAVAHAGERRVAIRSSASANMRATIDILIGDVPDDVLAAIDAKAKRVGRSRTEYLRRALERESVLGGELVRRLRPTFRGWSARLVESPERRRSAAWALVRMSTSRHIAIGRTDAGRSFLADHRSGLQEYRLGRSWLGSPPRPEPTLRARSAQPAVSGPMTAATGTTTSAGKPPRRACSRIVSASPVSWTQ